MKKEKINVALRDINRQDWQKFRILCLKEGLSATAKIRQMIKEEVSEK